MCVRSNLYSGDIFNFINTRVFITATHTYRSRFATNPSGVPGPSQPVGRYPRVPTYSRPVILCTRIKKVYLEVGTSKLGRYPTATVA